MIGIVTPYKTNNYGTKLQAYAMMKLFGQYDDTELIGFVPGTDMRIGSVLGKAFIKLKKRLEPKTPKTKQMQEREHILASFNRRYKFGPVIKGNPALKRAAEKYDTVVCGSDQLWAPTNVMADWFTLTLIPESIVRISYAASFGVSDIPDSLKNKYARFLNRLSAISVREERGVEIVKEITGRKATLVLDPTLMLDKEEWSSFADHAKYKADPGYIFCYFLGTNPEHRRFAKELAEKTGKRIITFPDLKAKNEADADFGDARIYDADPHDFVNFIRGADYVCTDSFHGSVFSIIFNRPLAVFERFSNSSKGSTNSRIYSLLDNLNMRDSLCSKDTDIDGFIATKPDYEDVGKRLDALKESSFNFIDIALNKQRRR